MIGKTYFFMHDNKVRTGILKDIFDKQKDYIRWHLQVDFLPHNGLTIFSKYCFESKDELLKSL